MTNEDRIKLDHLITKVSNTSHRCGAHNDEDDEAGYEILYKKACAAEKELTDFVVSLVHQCL